jgi:hypothetical protein
MLVIAEVLRSPHVQYRYFARYLLQLRHRFEVVIAVPSGQIDDHGRKLADEVVEFRITTVGELPAAVRLIEGIQPDVVFWPSVGMATWGPFLANLRFAPVQIVGLGHSASTFSPTMDYFLTEEAYISDPSLFSERLVLLPNDALRFQASPFEVRPTPKPREQPEILRIAVPGNALKLNPDFIGTLAAVESRCSRPLEFVFFPNTHPTQAEALRRAAGGLLKGVAVLPRLDPNEYLSALSECDLALSPFPFGGLHSTIDALSLGLPIVAMHGEEPHERTDALVMERLDLPEWLLAHNVADYIKAATAIISSDPLRLQLGKTIIASEPLEAFFGRSPLGLEMAVSDAVWAAYRHHEEIQKDERRTWHLDDLLALK